LATPAQIVAEITDGNGYAILPNLIPPIEAAAAREILLGCTDTPLVKGLPARNIATGQRTVGSLLHRGEIFERLVQHPALLEVAEALLGDDMTLSSYAARILEPGAREMGAHIDYPYWAMRGPFAIRPVLMLQVIWMMQDFTEENGATLVVPGSQRRGLPPDAAAFANEAIVVTGSSGSAIVSHGLLWHDTSRNRSAKPRVSMLINYGLKVIRPMEPAIATVPAEVIERATPKLRRLLGLDFAESLRRDLARRYRN
jgi:ectoine hydroxylase-related dioxygenase (phytanoyl-CoA dioxygenase family)